MAAAEDHIKVQRERIYQPGLNRLEEPVVSSHFMNGLSRDDRLSLYDDRTFSERVVTISRRAVAEQILPVLVKASVSFGHERARAAMKRARLHHGSYGCSRPEAVGSAEAVTEVMFDRQFRRGSRETCSRRTIRDSVLARMARGLPIEMVIPALPYKFSCPLKTRGQLPDLGEVNFLLGVHEILVAVDTLYRQSASDRSGSLARFTVICDGTRFNALVNEPDEVVMRYQAGVRDWLRRLGLDHEICLLDYRADIHAQLPREIRCEKEITRRVSRERYAQVMWPAFDPRDMLGTLARVARLDPDPERMNEKGRFVSLLESLAFTVRYRCLEPYRALPAEIFRAFYRDLTSHLFRSDESLPRLDSSIVSGAEKESLREAMLLELFEAAIEYISEIKSDRDLAVDPIALCLPERVRWTIHAKPGQLGIASPSTEGKVVQPWAGTAYFKSVGNGGIRLCSLPLLALEGSGAVPVCVEEGSPHAQPLFYIDAGLGGTGIDDFISRLAVGLDRRRSN